MDESEPARDDLEPASDDRPMEDPLVASGGGFRRLADSAAPRLRQARLNLRAWLTWPLSKRDRHRLVRYVARDHRQGLKWTVELPAQCWQCAATAGLRRRKLRTELRAFPYPVAAPAAALALVLSVLLLECVVWMVFKYILMSAWTFAALTVAALGLASAVVWLTSWRESVLLLIWTCPDHADELQTPDMVVDDEQLHVFLPTAALAKEANAELQDARRRRAARPWADERGDWGEGAHEA